MSLKTINDDALRFCTVLDVILKAKKIVTDTINLHESNSAIVLYNNEIDEIIVNSSEEIYAALYGLYRGTSNLEASAPWVGAKISNRQNNDATARLVACQAGASAICEHFTLTFSSATAYAASGFLSGGVGSSNISSDFTSSGDGDLIIAASTNSGIFSGTFASGDKIFISINKWHPFIAKICAEKSAARIMRELTEMNLVGFDPAVYERMSNRAQRNLERLQNPDDKNGMELSSLPTRDFQDITMGDWLYDSFDRFGQPDTDFFAEDDIESYTR